MLSSDKFNKFRVLGIVNVSAEGDIVDRYFSGYCDSFHGYKIFWFRHDVLSMDRKNISLRTATSLLPKKDE